MATQRMPVSVTASLALHGGLFGAYVMAVQMTPKHAAHSVGPVEILRVTRPVPPTPGAPKPPPPAPSLTNFLKLALPAIPKSAAPLELNMKLPEHQVQMKAPEILKEAARKEVQQIKPLDLGERAAPKALAALNVPEAGSHRVKALAALPVLNEVGRKQVANLPQAIKLEEQRQQAVQQMTFEKMNTPTHVRVAPAQAMLPSEAAPAQTSRVKKVFESVLPTEQIRERPQPSMRAAPAETFKQTAIAPAKRAGSSAMEEAKKGGVQIEGALKDRAVAYPDIPAYPDWLKNRGTPEASVRLNFCVDPSGNVVGRTISPDLSSGFGQLDRLCSDALRNWKFAPIGAQENQCGKITFNFVLE